MNGVAGHEVSGQVKMGEKMRGRPYFQEAGPGLGSQMHSLNQGNVLVQTSRVLVRPIPGVAPQLGQHGGCFSPGPACWARGQG